MQQNATPAGAPTRGPAGGAYSAPPDPSWFKGEGGYGGKGRYTGGEGKERRGAARKRKDRGGEADSDAQLEQGRRLAKAGPVLVWFIPF